VGGAFLEKVGQREGEAQSGPFVTAGKKKISDQSEIPGKKKQSTLFCRRKVARE